MQFKRPQVRYADTPQPATPYQAAEQVWDERIGSARTQAKNWRLMAIGGSRRSAHSTSTHGSPGSVSGSPRRRCRPTA